jgi:hypothetical protein
MASKNTLERSAQYPSNAESPDMNYQAYLQEAGELETTLRGSMLAYADGQRIAQGKDGMELARNIPQQYRHRPLLIKTTSALPVRFRHPLFSQPKDEPDSL